MGRRLNRLDAQTCARSEVPAHPGPRSGQAHNPPPGPSASSLLVAQTMQLENASTARRNLPRKPLECLDIFSSCRTRNSLKFLPMLKSTSILVRTKGTRHKTSFVFETRTSSSVKTKSVSELLNFQLFHSARSFGDCKTSLQFFVF